MDNKVVKMVSGRLGAPCVGCTDSRADFNDEEKVKKGSYLNMSAMKTNEKYLDLAHGLNDGSTEEDIAQGITIPSKDKDFAHRLGVKEKPMTTQWDYSDIPSVLHQGSLCSYRFCFGLIVRASSGCLQWGDGQIGKGRKERMETKEMEFKKRLGTALGFKETLPNQVNGNKTINNQ